MKGKAAKERTGREENIKEALSDHVRSHGDHLALVRGLDDRSVVSSDRIG
jgi:hypothetical protein